jgi:hypothetical protein
MCAAIGVRHPVFHGQKLLLAGDSILLALVRKFENVVQRHIFEGPDRFENLTAYEDGTKALQASTETLGLND